MTSKFEDEAEQFREFRERYTQMTDRQKLIFLDCLRQIEAGHVFSDQELEAIRKRVGTLGEDKEVCPVVDAGRRIQALQEYYDTLDAEDRRGNDRRATYVNATLADIDQQIQCLTDYISTLETESVEGAILQIAIASSLFDDVTQNVVDDRYREKASLQFNRLIYSATDFLRKDPSFDLPSIAVDRFMGDSLNPWPHVDRRLQIAESRDAAEA